MKLNKTQGDFLRGVIERWEAEGTITTDTANRLKTSYTVRPRTDAPRNLLLND